MAARALPYALGLFVSLPLLLWAVLRLAFPGGASGFEDPVTVGFFLVSLPLAVWFFLSNLHAIANPSGRTGPGSGTQSRMVRWTMRRLHLLSALLSSVVVLRLLGSDEPIVAVAALAVVGAVIPVAIWRGERARLREYGQVAPMPAAPTAAEEQAELALGEQLTIGVGNLLLLLVIGTLQFGAVVPLTAALILVPVAFVAMMYLAWDACRLSR